MKEEEKGREEKSGMGGRERIKDKIDRERERERKKSK